MATRAQEFMKMHDSGMSYQEIGDKNGISKERVRQVIRSEFPAQGGRMKQARAKVAEALAREEHEGVNIHDAAQRWGVSLLVASRRLRDAGVAATDNRNNVSPEKIDRFKDYAKSRLTFREVAEIEGVRYQVVSTFCKKHGIKLRDGRRSDRPNQEIHRRNARRWAWPC